MSYLASRALWILGLAFCLSLIPSTCLHAEEVTDDQVDASFLDALSCPQLERLAQDLRGTIRYEARKPERKGILWTLAQVKAVGVAKCGWEE